MAEYIEREKASLILREEAAAHYPTPYHVGLLAAARAIESIPAADVRPVARGRDICDTVDGHCEFKCSVCGVELSSVYGGNNDFGLDGGYFKFCPNCGAMMEES